MLNTQKHRDIMFQLLKDIFQSDIGKYLAFKGGTACYFLHGLDRFSTDLDFDLVEKRDIDERVISLLKKYGQVKSGNKILLSYGHDDINIKVDINRKIWKHNNYEIVNFYGTSIKVQDRATIFANKLVSLTERNTNRDIYDVYFMFQKLFPVNEELIRERTGKSPQELYSVIGEKLRKLPQSYKILDGLGEVLTEKQKSFVKTKLISELIGILEMKIHF